MQTTLTATLVENQTEIINQLDSVVVLHNKIQRNLYKDIVSYCIENKVKSLPKEKVNELKSSYQIKYPINARQYNSIYAELMGKISSVVELNKESISELKDKIKSLEKAVKSKQKNLDLILKKKELAKIDQINLNNLNNKLFYLKQRLTKANKKLKDLNQAQETNNPKLCFGSKKLFNQQFLIGTNNNLTECKSHNDWKKSWIESRNKSFVLVGSSDEPLGNQNCQINHISDDIYELKVNLNPKDPKISNRYINIKIKVHNDKLGLINNILNNNFKQAITYRFYKDYRNNTYQIFISLDKSKQKPQCISNKQIGTIGIDINADHLSVAETDRFGNLIKAFDVQLNLKDKSSNQSLDNIACAVKKITDYAVSRNKPIVIEKLDFSSKKRELKSGFDKTYNTMISSFAYSKIIELIKSRSYDKGIEVIEVNPAYTSKIGKFKYQNKYKLTTHQSAAFVIARRGLLSYNKVVLGKDNKEKSIVIINKEKTISNQLSKYYPFDLPVRNNQKQDNIYWKEIEQNYLKAKKHRLLSKKNKSLILDNIKLSCEITSVADSFEVYR
jgi:IS605 OrfB family transposase